MLSELTSRNNLTRLQSIKLRSQLLRALRSFFWQEQFIEVETPTRLITPALEDYIDAIPAQGKFLRTSPELHMKRLLCEGAEKIFQIGPCFREHEHGERHREEFTMLEWYEADCDYHKIASDLQRLLQFCSQQLGSREDYFTQQFEVLSLEDAFARYAKISLAESLEQDNFEETLCFEVEPHLGKERPTLINDYPSSMAALSRKKIDAPHLAERFELYVDGIELANAYSELTDASEQRSRFEECQNLRLSQKRISYDLDENFLKDMEKGMPEAGGIALGVDRLAMVLFGVSDINSVLAFGDEQ
ncbi:EF-P lysine aminoacylase EpmA [Lentisphaera profundi]|uniref:EF-P lysine aminoacylase EpmA n=1 Tax=Lentisphaera profundi TaxID=1658616 RepID=A0ABY7VSB2_9BACT|nr:EF-P lysine aminoacylase EpmA [Lentisphaera profundi]WDE96194.1 EF-P lysine aminoacylase EpmA [Lentisphaera profundi]